MSRERLEELRAKQGAIQAPIAAPVASPRQRLDELRVKQAPSDVALSPKGVVGAAQERERREVPELPFSGLLSGEDAATVAKVSAALLTTTDPQEAGQILRANVPSIRIVQDPEQGFIAVNQKTGATAAINKPDLSAMDVLQAGGIAAAFTPAARLAGLGATTAAKAGIGAAAAGTTEAGMQAIQEQLGGELDTDEIAIATALGGAAEMAIPAIQSFRQARRAKAVGAGGEQLEQVAKQVGEGVEASEATGIPLFQAQKTLVPAQLEKQAFVGQLPAGAQKASEQLRSQNQAASGAVDDLLNMIAPPEAVVTGQERFRTASQNAVTRLVELRKERVSPIYNEAFRGSVTVDTKPIKSVVDGILRDFPAGGDVHKTVSRINSLIKPAKSKVTVQGTTRPNNLKKMHNAKIEIDQILERVGGGSLGNTTKLKVLEIKNALLSEMDKVSPEYKSARGIFSEQSSGIDKITESLIGKIANIDDTQLKNVARRIFDPAETNPKVIEQAKRIIKEVDPDAWNELLRSELERRMGTIKSTLSETTTENVPAQLFNSVFGNKKQRDVLFRAVDGDMRKNLKYLETALSRARLGRPGGSQTAAREEIKRELRGVSSGIRDFFSKPISTLSGVGADVQFDRRVKSLTDVLFDPQWKPKMNKLRDLNSNSPASARAMVQLLEQAVTPQKEEQ